MIWWNGKTHYRCRETPKPVNGDWMLVEGDERPCGARKCPFGYCGSLFQQFKSDPDSLNMDIIGDLNRDARTEYLYYGRADFDDLRAAFIVTFQVLTVEGWIKLYNIYDDVFESFYVILYFYSLVII